MANLRKAMANLNKTLAQHQQVNTIPYEEFVKEMVADPVRIIRNVFQVFHDMIRDYVGTGHDEYPDDPESINYVDYDTSLLFEQDTDRPFFADRLFANRLINHVEAFHLGAQQNKIYIFEGPHGSGKSTFLNNLLKKFEEYANTREGSRYEVVWRLNRKMLGRMPNYDMSPMAEKILQILEQSNHHQENVPPQEQDQLQTGLDYLEVPCPSHDHPLLLIPKEYRRQFFDDVFQNDEFKWKLFNAKEYEWVFRDTPCTICNSLFQALQDRLKTPLRIYARIYARPYRFNRRLGEGISVFNPGDQPVRQNILTNPMLQRGINALFNDSNQVKYLYSRYAKTNNGIYALMDIKSHNRERLNELHNIISEGVHKVEDIEESVNSLLFALMNPEDKKNIDDIQSFSDRIEYINIPYVLDIKTEVKIYRNIFGRHIDEHFMPWVLLNFARVIVASRLNPTSTTMLEWIPEPQKYRRYCDENLMLLKMEIFTGYIPPWLSEEDRKRLTARRRRQLIAESEFEGQKGFSGRDSIKMFNEFYSTFAREDKLINMSMLCKFFRKYIRDKKDVVPPGFLDSLLNLYNFKILQEVKESLYYFNEEQISREIKNYIFAVNFDPGTVQRCKFTGDQLEITEEFFRSTEQRFLGTRRHAESFRRDVQKEYTSRTLTQEIMRDGLDITETSLYKSLHDRCIHNLKEKVLDPFLENENFRRAIKDFGKEPFKTYDKKIRDDVTFLMDNLVSRYKYSRQGAKEICMYVIDNDIAQKFAV